MALDYNGFRHAPQFKRGPRPPRAALPARPDDEGGGGEGGGEGGAEGGGEGGSEGSGGDGGGEGGAGGGEGDGGHLARASPPP